MSLEIEQFVTRGDNFGILLRDSETGTVGLIDAPEEKPILAAIERTGWQPSILFVTHHHGDHVEANEALKARFGLTIIGPKAEEATIPGIDRTVEDGDTLEFGSQKVRVIATPGHTLGHVNYLFEDAKALFAGDTLFAIGCGRLLEGTADQMHASLAKLAALPDDTAVYCGHEYTLANARFALTIDPDNADLIARAKEVEAKRARGESTLPTTIGAEKATNPFLRAGDAAIRARLGMEGAGDTEIFAEIRRRKDAA